MINLNDYFYYDESSPTCLRWNIPRSTFKKAGDVAGCIRTFKDRKHPVCVVELMNKPYFCHRVIWELFNGPIPEGMVIDHLDGNSSNNLISNLALKTPSGNQRNRKKNKNNTSGKTGVRLITNNYGYKYCIAFWREDSGRLRSKSFSCLKYGEEAALLMAELYRKEMIHMMNLEGAGYTTTHGERE